MNIKVRAVLKSGFLYVFETTVENFKIATGANIDTASMLWLNNLQGEEFLEQFIFHGWFLVKNRKHYIAGLMIESGKIRGYYHINIEDIAALDILPIYP